MASSDIIKIGFDYRSSLAQFEKDTNGVFDGISSKAGKQKITIQLDAKDDKVIDKIKELQKLKLDKFTFEFGNSGLKEQLQTFDKLENKINEIINLGKGKSIIDSSSTIKEIDKINKSLNKTSEILNKSFSTKNKTEAFNQLKEASVAYEKFYGNEKAMATQEGTQAAYNYYKAYEEALKKGVAQTRLEKVTIDVEKGYNFNSSDLSSRRIKEFENYQKYGGDLSDLSLEIASLDGKLKDFSSAYAEVKKNLGEAPITPEIISNIEHYVELLDKVRYLKSWHKSDDKDIIAQDESSAKYFLDSAIYKAQEQNYNYTDSLKTQEIQAIATAEAEKKLAETQKEVSFTSSETNISLENSPKKDAFPKTDSSATNASTSAIKEENNALEQTTQSAEKAANSKKKFANANKEVKDSANASVGAIKDENNAFDKNEWDKNVKAIQKYMDTVTELNHLKAKDKGTGKNTSVIADQEQEVERLKNIAYEAKKTLSSIANSNKADVNTWEKWVNIMKQFDQASQGSTRSIARLEDAMRNANNSQIEYMNSVIKRFQNSYDKYSTDASRNGYNPSVEFSDKLSSFNSSLNDLKNLSSSISNGEFVKQEQIDSFKRLTQNAEEAQKSLKNMSASEKGMKSVSVQKEIDKINQLLRENTRYSKEAKIELRSLITQLMSGDPTVNLEAIHTKVMEIKNAEELAGRAGKNFFDILASKSYYGFIGQMQSYLSMYVGFYGMMNSFRNGLSTVRELNTALTEMRKVSEETTQSLKNYQNTTFDVANVVGTTAKQIQNSTADWMRLGESMSEAAESAKDANILFNVSEFEGIDEATESLVSMSQAYKDLDKMDIINVLNNIGNNYSISTDGLATALKDSASALVTANNDLNEAVSLTTAGNAITQDPSKVGAGLRTISLRLVGTEEAKQELSDLGEETDGMITTVSKLRDTIMDATKAASADGKGFDILDDNGNYKSTYEIMQGLADLYDDIVKKDKELGTNNLNLLLETIAGKNRSNIAASILQNGEMLKSVYEDAQNSEGSAEQELNSYLDSVDGKLQQLSNRAQEFWFKVIDSETIKNGIDLLTNLTKGATDFVDTIGILPTLLTGIGAGIAVKNVGEHYIVPVSI
jgi:TP901 family phage tail tape measure protein